MEEHHIEVLKTARFYTLGQAESETKKEVWIVCHGYSQLAADFIKNFGPLQSKNRLIIAPEALSRFYTDGNAGRVGASWMTKEARADEIYDQARYLDKLYKEIVEPMAPEKIIILGFSQGTATVARWVAGSNIALNHLVLWGGFFPPDMDWDNFHRSGRNFKTWVVNGDRDKLITEESRKNQQTFIRTLPSPPEVISFPGGHTIPDNVLLDVAARMEFKE